MMVRRSRGIQLRVSHPLTASGRMKPLVNKRRTASGNERATGAAFVTGIQRSSPVTHSPPLAVLLAEGKASPKVSSGEAVALG